MNQNRADLMGIIGESQFHEFGISHAARAPFSWRVRIFALLLSRTA
jgi:hypothetical protein